MAHDPSPRRDRAPIAASWSWSCAWSCTWSVPLSAGAFEWSARHRSPSKKKILLCERQLARGLAEEEVAVGPHFVGLRVDFHPRKVAVVDQVSLADGARPFHGHHPF